MTLTVIKVFYNKQKPNIVTYRNYKHFSNEAFIFDVKNSIIQMTSERNDLEFDRFKTALDKAIQRHAPIKKRYVQANQAPFINKKINKEIMKRSRLRNKFFNIKSDIDRNNTDNKTPQITKSFGKRESHFFTDKIKIKSKITLIKKKCLPGRSRENSFRKKNYRRSGCSKSF